MRRFLTVLCGVFLFFSVQAQTVAPSIQSYLSDIHVNADGTVNVTEILKVVTDGNIILHGIYRDFPVKYPIADGKTRTISFNVIETQLDDKPISYFIKSLGNDKRIYIGDKDVMLPPALHTFLLSYRVKNVIGFFEDHDELYWNVTGNAWVFPIQEVDARVTLPQGAEKAVTGITGYTGFYGSKEQALRYFQSKNGQVFFATTSPLTAQQGLTIVVGWKKGFIFPPTRFEQLLNWLQENFGIVLMGLGFLLVTLYYSIVWWRVGRGPHPGVVFPEYEPPKDFGPAAIRYITDMGYDQKVFVAAIVSMAIKGYLVINQVGDNYSLTRKKTDLDVLTGPETKIAINLFSEDKTTVDLDKNNALLFYSAISSFKDELRKEFEDLYFITNAYYCYVGIALSIITLLASWFLYFELQPFTLIYYILLVALMVINIIFYHVLKAPTLKGRALMDHIAGFKMFLAATETERLKFFNPPDKTPALFDKYLPYAIALDVEENWSNQFSNILTMTMQDGTRYQPSWYNGSNFTRFSARQFSSNLTQSLSAAVANTMASSAARGGSGFGGGGFSGGGFGGGGGGGW